MKSHTVKIVVSLALTAVLLYFFFRGVDIGATKEAILGASPGWLAASLALGVLTFFFRAVRWVWILRPVARVHIGPAFTATAAGFAANNLPGKVGEVLRPYLKTQEHSCHHQHEHSGFVHVVSMKRACMFAVRDGWLLH